MKKLLKKSVKFLEKMLKIFRWLILSFYKVNRTAKINIEDNKVLIIGNGPSAGNFNYTRAKESGFVFACVNYFALNRNSFENIQPKYYILLDRSFYGKTDNDDNKRLYTILENISWDMYIICVRKELYNFHNPHIHKIYINGNELNDTFRKLEKKFYDQNKATFGYQNVILGGLFCFISGNVKNIALIGVEYDWHKEYLVDQNNDIIREYVHFYGKEVCNLTENGILEKHKLYLCFYEYYVTLYRYYLASLYAKDKQVNITNLTTNSYIDTFDKKSVDEYFCLFE